MSRHRPKTGRRNLRQERTCGNVLRREQLESKTPMLNCSAVPRLPSKKSDVCGANSGFVRMVRVVFGSTHYRFPFTTGNSRGIVAGPILASFLVRGAE